MQEKSLTPLDFDEAVELARKDPDAFERYRQDAIEALITKCTKQNQQQLRRLQWRIERERRKAPNPTAACIRIYQMMWDSFVGDNGFVDVLCNENYSGRQIDETRPKAPVLSLAKARQSVAVTAD